MRPFQRGSLFVGLLLCLLIGADASAQTILYSDSFDRTTGSGDPNGNPGGGTDPGPGFSDWGTNDNASGGTISNAWITGPNRGGGANQVTDGDLASTVEGAAQYLFDITTMAPSGFTVEFEFNRFSPFNPPDPFGTNNGFLSVGLGADTGAVLGGGQFNVNNADVTLLFQQAVGDNQGNTQIFQDNMLLLPAMEGDTGPIDYGDPLTGHAVELTFVPAVNGQYGDADTVNGSVIIDGGSPFEFSVLGGTEFGNLSFNSNGFVHRTYDNLVVTALPVTSNPSDADDDGDVDGADFLILQRDNPAGIAAWQAAYSAPLSAISSVPEPGTFVSFAVGTLMFIFTDRRRSK